MPARYVGLKASDPNLRRTAPNVVEADIYTGGSGAPLVTLWGNNGFPPVKEVYAIVVQRPNGWSPGNPENGVHVLIRFESDIPGSAVEIAISLYQDDLTGSSFPWPLSLS